MLRHGLDAEDAASLALIVLLFFNAGLKADVQGNSDGDWCAIEGAGFESFLSDQLDGHCIEVVADRTKKIDIARDTCRIDDSRKLRGATQLLAFASREIAEIQIGRLWRDQAGTCIGHHGCDKR